MYPVLDIEKVILHATNLFRFMEAALRNGLASEFHLPSNQGIKDDNTNVLKMVLAIALIVEGSGESETGNRLYESVKNYADIILHRESIDFKTLPLLVLVVSLNAFVPSLKRKASVQFFGAFGL
jgi:hypothetical protein